MISGAAIWGAGAAISWGVGDFSARFAGQRAGVISTTFWMMVASLLFTSVYMLCVGENFVFSYQGLPFLIAAGIGIALATLLFYEAITTGPVSIASPIVACYPAIALPISIGLGARPGLLEWAGMIITLIGIWIASRYSPNFSSKDNDKSKNNRVRRTAILAFSAATIFALAISSLDIAVDYYAPATTLLGVRAIGIICFLVWFIIGKKIPGAPVSTWWLIALVGLLDTGGHLFLYFGLEGEHGEYAVVASSAYTVVTVLLARVFLKETVTSIQWVGITLVVFGIGILSGFG